MAIQVGQGEVRLQTPSACLQPDQLDFSPYLFAAGVLLPGQQSLVVQEGSEAARQLCAFIALCVEHPAVLPAQLALSLIESGEDRDAFFGALHLMKAGLIDARIPEHAFRPGEDWLNHLARVGYEPAAEGPQRHRAISIAERELALVRFGLARARDSVDAAAGPSPLFSAAEGANRPALLRLLSRMGQRSAPPRDALHRAAKEGNAQAVRRLLKRGANPDHADGDGTTAMHYAAGNGQIEVLGTLLEFNADINISDRFFATPLHQAARMGSAEAIAFLAARGARLNAQDDLGDTPLHFAVFKSQRDAVVALIAAGADLRVRNSDHETPLQMAKRLQRQELLGVLDRATHGDVFAV